MTWELMLTIVGIITLHICIMRMKQSEYTLPYCQGLAQIYRMHANTLNGVFCGEKMASGLTDFAWLSSKYVPTSNLELMARNHPVRLFIILAQYSNELGWRYSQKCWSFPEGGRVFGLKFNWLRRNLWNVQTSKKPSSNRMTTTPKKSPSCSPSFCPHLNNRIFKGKRYLVISTDCISVGTEGGIQPQRWQHCRSGWRRAAPPLPPSTYLRIKTSKLILLRIATNSVEY